MTKQRLKVVFIVSWILITLILAIPSFSFNIGEQRINVNYSDQIATQIGSTLGNFQRSFGVFNSKEVKTTLNFTKADISNDEKKNKLLEYAQIIKQRIQAANLYDVELRSEISNNNEEYSLVFTYPEYYNDPVKYSEWLAAKASISFVSSDQNSPTPISLNDFDIGGAVNVDYLDTIGTHIVFRVVPTAVLTIQQAFAASPQSSYFLMNIDNIPSYFIIQYDQFTNTNEELVRVLPTQAILLTTAKERNDYINITRSYFLNSELEDSFTVDQSIITKNPIFKADSATLIGQMFILSAILLGIFFFRRFKFAGLVKYIFSITTFILTFVSALKILSGNLSISFLLGFILIYFIVNSILYYLLKETIQEEDIKNNIRLIRDLSLFGFILLAIIYKVIPNLGILADMFGAALIGFLVLFFVSIIHIRFIFELFFNFNIKRLRLPKIKTIKNENN